MANFNIKPKVNPIDSLAIIEATVQVLDNGVELYNIKTTTDDVIGIEVIFDAGSVKQNQLLQASFTNTMLTNGTASKSAREIAEFSDSYGSFMFSTMDRDGPGMELYCLAEHFELMLPLLEDCTFNSSMPHDEFKSNIKRNKSKFLVELEITKNVARRKLIDLIFGVESGYGQNPNIDSYEALNVGQVRDFYHKYYQTNKFNIIFIGRLTEKRLALINVYFGKRPVTCNNHDFNYSFQPSDKRELHIEKDDVVQSSIVIGRRLFNRSHHDYVPTLLMNLILGGYFGSRLMANIREDKGYTYGIHSSITSLKYDGYFSIATDVGVDNTRNTLNEIYYEISRLKTDLVSEVELERIKNYFCGKVLKNADGPFACAELLKRSMLFDSGLQYYGELIDEIRSINAEDVRRVAKLYLAREELKEVIVGKFK